MLHLENEEEISRGTFQEGLNEKGIECSDIKGKNNGVGKVKCSTELESMERQTVWGKAGNSNAFRR